MSTSEVLLLILPNIPLPTLSVPGSLLVSKEAKDLNHLTAQHAMQSS